MERMAKSSVLICGMGGLGIEVAKNVILSGAKVQVVTLQDTATVTKADLGAQFFLQEADAGTNRVAACFQRAAELNSSVAMQQETGPLNEDLIQEHSFVVLTNSNLAKPVSELQGMFGNLT